MQRRQTFRYEYGHGRPAMSTTAVHVSAVEKSAMCPKGALCGLRSLNSWIDTRPRVTPVQICRGAVDCREEPSTAVVNMAGRLLRNPDEDQQLTDGTEHS